MNLNKEINLECTVNLHKRIFGKKFKNRASLSIKELKNFASKTMKSKDIKIDNILNKKIWENGRKHVPFRIRIRLSKKLVISENGKEKWVVFVNHLNSRNTKFLCTKKIK
jgi:large subunit ribosomal protein L31e